MLSLIIQERKIGTLFNKGKHIAYIVLAVCFRIIIYKKEVYSIVIKSFTRRDYKALLHM